MMNTTVNRFRTKVIHDSSNRIIIKENVDKVTRRRIEAIGG